MGVVIAVVEDADECNVNVLQLDYAARIKSPAQANKAYSDAVAALDNIVSSL